VRVRSRLAFAFAVVLAFALSPAGGARAKGRTVTIEKATLPWSELERLLAREGAQPPPARSAPYAYAVPSLDVRGLVAEGRAALELTFEIEVLQDRWTVAPLLPPALAVSQVTVDAPEGRRGLLVRERSGVAFVGEGAGRYQLSITCEGTLDAAPAGGRLAIAPPGLAGGRARLSVRADQVEGRTAWRSVAEPGGVLTVEAALGASGLELIVPSSAPSREAGASLEELEAVSVLSLGGAGVTRVTVMASPDERGELELTLPSGAHLWKAYVGGAALSTAQLGKRDVIRVPLKKPARVELAYTFDAPPMGIRGRYRVELPRLPVPVRNAEWEVWLPDGLSYAAPQASLAPAGECGQSRARTRTPIAPQGKCRAFARPVLVPGRAYVEGAYDQPL
jgi:hypothetical protein